MPVNDSHDILRRAIGNRARVKEPLTRHTTFRIGGPADLFVESKRIAELVEWVGLARQHAVAVRILGNGSNVLVLDAGVRGLVIENHCDAYRLDMASAEQARLYAESGVSLPLLANRLSRQGWSGLEWAIGVPGSLGGAIVGNAGAHGGCIADSLTSARVLDRAGAIVELPKTEIGFAYRSSRFKRIPGEIVLSAELELVRDEPQNCIARMARYTEHRRRTQPTEASVGSMFKNPPGDFAGRLIEQAGLKGTRIGNVEVSTIHANFFVNHGSATAAEVLRLIETVQDGVRKQFGINLELEIELLGVAETE